MRYLSFYKDVLGCETPDRVFEFLIANLKPSNTEWSYFVDWDKVFEKVRQNEIALNSLNYLIGKDDFEGELRLLLLENPAVARVIPALALGVGSWPSSFDILVDYQNRRLVYEHYDFLKDNPSDSDIDSYIRFFEETGIKSLINDRKIKSLVDYAIGLEVGLNSNSRKNRGGKIMEKIVGVFVKDACARLGFRYISDANDRKIKREFGYEVPVDKSSRRYDFVIDTGTQPVMVETNFYNTSGSKLKSTAGEYQDLHNALAGRYTFIWITDGPGWLSTRLPLQQAFNNNDHIFSLLMLERGVLEHLLR